jgi:tyrosine-specific transport protein
MKTKRFDKKFWATTFTLSGATIGAGILGLPYIFAKSGFLSGLFWLIVLGAVILFVNLSIGEVTLRTKGKHQLAGYAKLYLGPYGQKLMFFGTAFGIYSALIAYLVGEGESLSKLLPGEISPIYLGIAFWIIMTVLLREGLKSLKKVETYGVIAIISIIIGLFIRYLPQIDSSNLLIINSNHFAAPIGIVLFSLLGFTSIPELRTEIKGKEKLFRRAIIIGTLIPIALYIIFTSIFVGILGNKVTEVATLSFGGPFMTILGIFTMLTSYFVLSFSLKDTFKYDIKASKQTTFIFTSLLPLALYILITSYDLLDFAAILGIGGVISGGTTGIIILLMNKKSKNHTRNKKDPEILMPVTWLMIALISIIFISGIFIHFFG